MIDEYNKSKIRFTLKVYSSA